MLDKEKCALFQEVNQEQFHKVAPKKMVTQFELVEENTIKQDLQSRRSFLVSSEDPWVAIILGLKYHSIRLVKIKQDIRENRHGNN